MADHMTIDPVKAAAWQRRWEAEFRSRWVECDGKFYPPGVELPSSEETARRQRIREASRLVRDARLMKRREVQASKMRARRAEGIGQ